MTKAAATEGSSQIYSILFRALPDREGERDRERGGVVGDALVAVLATFVLGFLI